MSQREPRWDIDRRRGERGERLTNHVIDSLASDTTEVKTDDAALKTGNVYIEYACRSRGTEDWHYSGIATTQATWWVTVVGEVLIGAPVEHVRTLVREEVQAKRVKECSRGSNPTKGVVVPLGEFVKRLARIYVEALNRDAA